MPDATFYCLCETQRRGLCTKLKLKALGNATVMSGLEASMAD